MSHRIRIGWALFAGWLVSAALLGCKDQAAHATAGPGDLETAELRYQGFNSTVLFPELAEDLGYLAPLRLKWVGNTISGPQDIQAVVTGDTDFGGAFNGAVLKLIAAKAPIRAVIGYYGADEQTFQGFFVTADSPIRKPRDLIGKKIAMNTLGAHSEFMLREYLSRGGLSPDEIKQLTMVVVPPINGEQALRQHQVDVTTLGNIFKDKALERGGLRLLFSDRDLYGTFTAGSIVVGEKTLRQKPHAVRKFVEGTARAIEWARTQPREVVQERMRKIIAARRRNEDAGIVAYWKSTGVAHTGGLLTDSEFQMWIDWLQRDGQLKPGQLVASKLYTNEFNPFRATP